MSKLERLARLMKIVTVVKSNSKLTRSDLAQLCEVNSVRTIQRDINSLAVAEVPIYWSGKGYEIMSNFFLPPVAMTEEEALSLVLSAKAYSEDEGGVHKSSIGSAISKIVDALPEMMKRSLEARLRIISIESRKVPDIEGLIIRLYQAVSDREQLCMNYYSYKSDRVSERLIEPYALTFRRRAWYLVAFCHTSNDILAFRTNQIRTLDYTSRTFLYPPDFSLEEYIARDWKTISENGGEEIEVAIEFDAAIAPLIKEVDWYPTQHIEDLPSGSILYTATVADTEEISSRILEYGCCAEVISPESLREEMMAVARKMCQRYEDS